MGKGKKKQVKAKATVKVASAAPFVVVTFPGGKEHPFTTEVEVAAYIRAYLNAGHNDYIVAKGDGTPIFGFDPYAGHLYSREEAVDELAAIRAKHRDLVEQVSGFRGVKEQKANQAIAAGLIPTDVLKGHVHEMAYTNEGGHQMWTLKLHSFGPPVTDDSPLTRALVALTDHLGVSDEETIGNPDDAAAVVTDLPDVAS